MIKALRMGQVHRAALLLGALSVVSALLALWRTRLIAGSFGPSAELDVYYAAFYLPDIIFFSIVLSVSLFVLVPRLSTLSPQEHRSYITRMILMFSVVMVVAASAAWLLAPAFLSWRFASLLHSPLGGELVFLTRLLLLQTFLLGVSNIAAAFLQVRHAFFLYAISPIVYSLSIIAGLLWVYPHFGLRGLGWMVVLGALLHAVIGLWYLWQAGEGYKQALTFDWREFWLVVRDSLPRTAGLALQRIAFVFLASTVATAGVVGLLGQFQIANDLTAALLNVLGASYSVASFALLSQLWAEKKLDRFKHTIAEAASFALFWAVPLSIVVFFWAEPILQFLLGTGAFSEAAVTQLAMWLRWFIITLPLQVLVMIFMRVLYAQNRAYTSLLVNTLGAAVLAAVPVMLHGQGVPIVTAAGVGLVSSAAVLFVLSASVLWRQKVLTFSRGLLVQLALASAILTGFVWWGKGVLMVADALFLKLVFAGAVAGLLWVGILYLFGNQQARRVVAFLRMPLEGRGKIR